MSEKVEYEYFFVRSPKYEDALKEADELKKQGWQLRKWHYEAMTCRFVLTMERVKEQKEDNTKPKEEEKPWRRKIKKAKQ